MRAIWLLPWLLLPGLDAQAADVCNPADLFGPYAFQLTGSTNIAGPPKPVASLGRMIFDGHGSLSGTASTNFRGLLLGNPVTGSYEAKSDCSVTWKLQDDSGAFQNFSGTLSTDGTRVQFKQTDPGGAQHGIMQKTPDMCTVSDLRQKYDFTVSGSTTPMLPGQGSRSVSEQGRIDIAANGTFQVESDCSVQFQLTLKSEPLNMRGFLVNGGKEILAFQTDPGTIVAARLF